MKKIALLIVSFLVFLVIALNNSLMKSLYKISNENSVAIDNSNMLKITKEGIIKNYMHDAKVSYKEASETLFPDKSEHNLKSLEASSSDVAYEKINLRSFQGGQLQSSFSENAGTIYFYCEVTKGGYFRAIKRIIYAGYSGGGLVFNGIVQYALPDPNRIHYTINGGLYSNTEVTSAVGGSVEIGEASSFNVYVRNISNFNRNIYHHGYRYY